MATIKLYKDFSQVVKVIGLDSSLIRDEQILIYNLDDIKIEENGVCTPHFRQGFFDITLFIDVEFQWKYSYHNYQINAGTLQIVPLQQTQQIIASKEEVIKAKGYTLYFKPELIASVIDLKQFQHDFSFLAFNNLNPILKLNKEELQEVLFLFQRIHYEFLKRKKFTGEIIKGYLIALLHTIRRIDHRIQKGTSNRQKPFNRELDYVSRFQSLLFQSINDLQSVIEYANLLCLSPKYLSEVLKNNTGKTALQHIHETLIIEAKNLLINTDSSISEIAYQFKFSDSSNFTKFFKKHTGTTPKRFRSQNK